MPSSDAVTSALWTDALVSVSPRLKSCITHDDTKDERRGDRPRRNFKPGSPANCVTSFLVSIRRGHPHPVKYSIWKRFGLIPPEE